MNGLVGSPVEIPREGSDVTAYWVGETEAPTATDMTFEQLRMEPHGGAAMVKLSQRLLRQSGGAAETVVRNSMTSKLALLIDLAGLRGDGTNGSPLGITQAADVLTTTIGANGGDPTYTILLDIVAEVRNNSALDDAQKPGWIMAPEVFRMVQALVDGNNRPLLVNADQGIESSPASMSLLGYPVFTSAQLPTNLVKGSGTDLSEVIFGDIATVIAASWAGLEIKASDVTEDAFKKRQVHVLAFQEVDIAVQQPGRICVTSDVSSA
jgi:HK97 family phage major capsid protein